MVAVAVVGINYNWTQRNTNTTNIFFLQMNQAALNPKLDLGKEAMGTVKENTAYSQTNMFLFRAYKILAKAGLRSVQ